MKLFKSIILMFLLTSLLTSCNTGPVQGANNAGTASPASVTEIENVSIRISEVSPIGGTVIIKDTNDPPYLYGSWFRLEKETDGIWQDVDPVIDNYGFDSVGYMTDTNHEVTFAINWEWLYGSLATGHYRLIKESSGKLIAAEFYIP